MRQITALPDTCPVCTDPEVVATRQGFGGYPVEMLLPLAHCGHCGWLARLVYPEEITDPVDLDELRSRAARAWRAHPEWDHLDLRAEVVDNGWSVDPEPGWTEVAAWAGELAAEWGDPYPTGSYPDQLVGVTLTVVDGAVHLTPSGGVPIITVAAEPPSPAVVLMPGLRGVLTREHLVSLARTAHGVEGMLIAARSAVREVITAAADEVRETTLAALRERWIAVPTRLNG